MAIEESDKQIYLTYQNTIVIKNLKRILLYFFLRRTIVANFDSRNL